LPAQNPSHALSGQIPVTHPRCIAIHVTDIEKAAAFYGEVLGFKLVSRTADQLEYDSGTFLLYVNLSACRSAPIPSLSVSDIASARQTLTDAGCEIVEDRGGSLYFRDPFGAVFDVIEE
jgi:catechol 2,3-dioxygenase-like lactoylglutathione lyase family enzyme